MLTTTPSLHHRRPRQAGVTLIELMVSLTVGLLVVGAMTAIFLQSSRARNANERINRQVENARYAMQLITTDLQQAGYYDAYDPDPSSQSYLAPPATLPDPCDITVAGLKTAIALPIQGYDSKASNPLASSCISDFKTGTDVLVIRRASSCVAGPTADTNCDAAASGDYLFQASLCGTEITAGSYFVIGTTTAAMTLHKRDCATLANYRRLQVHIYYIANNNKAGDGVPTLKRVELINGGMTATPEPLVEGIEDLQIEYGIDTTVGGGSAAQLKGDGIPDVVTADPSSYNPGTGVCSATTSPTCTQYWQAVVTANVHLLARNTQSDGSYTDTKKYVLGLNADSTQHVDQPGGNYERHAYQALVRLYNPNYRRLTQ
jgi:type IV pilus assembly protein PilW